MCNDCVQLWQAINDVSELADKSTPINQYDTKTAIADIKAYVSHLIRDVQQQKAKVYAFSCLEKDETALFWLKDYCQKVIPMKFREGQVDYFGKKGMSLHVDVLFRLVDGEMKKFVYFTAMQRSDQDAEDILALAEHVLKQIKLDHPDVKTIYTKSDNASCYHNSIGPEALYRLCLEKNLTLLRYDFNEPCRGKDQCDRESANAKTILRSYLCAGNDVMTAEDIYDGLHYGYGVKDAAVSVATNDKSKSNLTGKKTANFTRYHSIEFKKTGMRVWRYYGIGRGIDIAYVNTTFEGEGFSVAKELSKTEQIQRQQGKVKQRKDRVLRNLFFCQEDGCSRIFENQEEYEAHCLRGDHDGLKDRQNVSSMDQVKKSYISMMKISAPKVPMTYGAASTSSRTEVAVMSSFNEMGWALPSRAFFRYTDRQKKILYDIFTSGRDSNKKATAEQAVQVIRNQLPVEEFVKVKQVKALFSRWYRQDKKGELNVDDLDVDDDEAELVEDADDDAVAFNQHIQKQASKIFDDAEKSEESILFKNKFLDRLKINFRFSFQTCL